MIYEVDELVISELAVGLDLFSVPCWIRIKPLSFNSQMIELTDGFTTLSDLFVLI